MSVLRKKGIYKTTFSSADNTILKSSLMTSIIPGITKRWNFHHFSKPTKILILVLRLVLSAMTLDHPLIKQKQLTIADLISVKNSGRKQAVFKMFKIAVVASCSTSF